MHATVADLETWMGEQTVPANAERLLARASELVDELVVVAYPTDSQGDPTDETVAGGLRDATCAQVEWWTQVGEQADLEGQVVEAQIGSVRLVYGHGADRVAPTTVAPRTLRALHNAGLGYRGVGVA